MTRRAVLLGSGKLALGGAIAVAAGRAGGLRVLAQDATPVAGGGDLGSLGLPELTVTISDTGYEGLPTSTEAGRYLVSATNNGSGPAFVEFMQLPEGMSMSDMMGPPADATPLAAASPEGNEGEEGPPEWYYTVHMAGGAGINPGGTARMVLDLRPGTYLVWGEDPSAPQMPVELQVTGEGATPAAGSDPQASVRIVEVDTDQGFAFTIEGEFVPGSQVVEVVNPSSQPHFVEFARLPGEYTADDVLAAFMSQGTPVAGGLNPAEIQPVAFIGTQSAGTTQWHEITLEDGYYAVACWIGDPTRENTPHAMEGMIDVITVGNPAGATPTS